MKYDLSQFAVLEEVVRCNFLSICYDLSLDPKSIKVIFVDFPIESEFGKAEGQASGNTIILSINKRDISNGDINPVDYIFPQEDERSYLRILAHELRHVWQFENNYNYSASVQNGGLEQDARNYENKIFMFSGEGKRWDGNIIFWTDKMRESYRKWRRKHSENMGCLTPFLLMLMLLFSFLYLVDLEYRYRVGIVDRCFFDHNTRCVFWATMSFLVLSIILSIRKKINYYIYNVNKTHRYVPGILL